MKESFAPKSPANHLSATPEQSEPMRTPLDTLTTDLSDIMTDVNSHSTDSQEALVALTDRTMLSLDDLALTQNVLANIELSGDDAALTNKVVARDIAELRMLQERYSNLALDTANDNPDGNTSGAQLTSLQSAINTQLDTFSITTPDGKQPIDFSVLDETPASEVAQPVATETTPTFAALAAEHGVDANEFGDVSDILDNNQSFGSVDTILDTPSEHSFGDVDDIIGATQTEQTFGNVDDILDTPASAFGSVDTILEVSSPVTSVEVVFDEPASTFGDVDDILTPQATAALPETQATTAEKQTTPRFQRLKNYLFAASLGVAQLPQKAAKAYHDHQLRETLKNPDDKERRDRRVGLGIAMGGVALLGAGLIARHYGFLDGNETIADVQAPNYPYDLDHTPSFTTPEAATPDTTTPDVITPDTPPATSPDHSGDNTPSAPIEAETVDRSAAFTVRFGGGGEELMKQLGVSPQEWYKIAPDLLEKFPRDFYPKTDDGSIAGIMRPGELPENVQQYLTKQLNLS